MDFSYVLILKKDKEELGIYNQMLCKLNNIDEQIQCVNTQLEQLPEGKLVCSKNGKHYKWYRSDGHEKIYIPKKERLLAEKLAVKKYLTYLERDLQRERKAICTYLKNTDRKNKKAEQLLENESEYKNLLSSYFTPLSRELSEWIKSSYEKNPKHPEQLIHKGYSGNLVRSKTEAMIDMVLYKNKIPFRYECALQLGEITIFPDFTIRHPRTGETYYFEHFGMMDNPAYAQNVYKKLQLYTSHGIIPSIHLITTYETKDLPISMELIEKIITHYFG